MRNLLRVVYDLCAIPDIENDNHELAARVQDVLDDHDITPAEFRELDERPGRWGYVIEGREWHWKLRRYRNNLQTYARYKCLKCGRNFQRTAGGTCRQCPHCLMFSTQEVRA